MSAKQAINDKLQGSVATHLRCGRVVNDTTGGPAARSMAGPQRQAAAAVPWMVVRRRLKS